MTRLGWCEDASQEFKEDECPIVDNCPIYIEQGAFSSRGCAGMNNVVLGIWSPNELLLDTLLQGQSVP